MIYSYQLLIWPWLWLIDDLILEGKTPKQALENHYKRHVKRVERIQSLIVIWTWKKRLWFNFK
jgi:hypothetical protein